jgi:hypothetical protein
VPGKIAGSLEGEISAEPEWLSEQVSVLAEDRVIFPLSPLFQFAPTVTARRAPPVLTTSVVVSPEWH